MKIKELNQLLEEAKSFADTAAGLFGETLRADSAAVSAQISMAKSLAVIAEMLLKQYVARTESEE